MHANKAELCSETLDLLLAGFEAQPQADRHRHDTHDLGVSFALRLNRVMSKRLKVAFVAPSLRILGGQAVQADRLLDAWQNDPDVDAWLVPVNPLPPKLLRWALHLKYLRTIVTELTYLRLLLRELARADVVHVFSASYASFLLAPLPAMLIARALGRPVVLNYRSGEAPDHLRRSAIARKTIARVDLNVVPSRFLVDVFRTFGIRATVVPNIVDRTLSAIGSETAPSAAGLDAELRCALQRREGDDPRVPHRPGPPARRDVDPGRRRSAGGRAASPGRRSRLRSVTFVGRVSPGDRRFLRRQHLHPERTSTTCRRR